MRLVGKHQLSGKQLWPQHDTWFSCWADNHNVTKLWAVKPDITHYMGENCPCRWTEQIFNLKKTSPDFI